MAATGVAGAGNRIERAHQMYREGRHEEALAFYTEALAMARTKAQRIALHSNRAACYLKLHDFKKAAEECTSVLELDHQHTGALMLRAQTLVTLKEYQSALFDVNRLMELNPSSDVYRNLQARLKTQLSLAPIPESEEEALVLEEEEIEEEGTMEYVDKKIEQPSSIRECPATQTHVDKKIEQPRSVRESPATQTHVDRKIEQPSGIQESPATQTHVDKKIERPSSIREFPAVDKMIERPSSIQESLATQTHAAKKIERPSSIQESPATQTHAAKKIEQPSNIRESPATWTHVDKKMERPSSTRESPATQTHVDKKIERPSSTRESLATQSRNIKSSANVHPRGWEAIPKPKGHSGLDYSRWDKVEDDSSEDEEEEEEEQQPQYRFRVRTVGVRSVR